MIPIEELLCPLTPEEMTTATHAISRLQNNADFHLVFRWMNQNCGGIASTSFDPDPAKAAFKDGQKSIPRDVFRHLLALRQPDKEKQTAQDTSP